MPWPPTRRVLRFVVARSRKSGSREGVGVGVGVVVAATGRLEAVAEDEVEDA